MKARAVIWLAILILAGCGGGHAGSAPTYTVGGTVSDLRGSGLVLRDNGGDALAITRDGAFTFSTRLSAGAMYSVSVDTQPTGPNQTCTVGNGAGQLGNDVTTVTVICTTNAYRVGGSVSGLVGAGLVLRDNGGDDLRVPANGPFAFTTPVASGAAYSIAVASQPSSPTQSCTVSSAAGTVTDGDVTSVAVGCVTLTPPPPVAVSPARVNVAAGGSQQFAAIVAGTPSTAVTWEVNGTVGGNAAVGTVSSTGLYTAPDTTGTVVVSAFANADPSQSGEAQVTIIPVHRIAVRTAADGLAELYDRVTGSTFTARGNNFVRLATLTLYGGGTTVYHSTFNVELYDAAGAEAALSMMQQRGFNTVRVFLDGCCIGTIGDPAGGLSSAYLTNVVDFLNRAKQHALYVIFTQDWLPATGGYDTTCPQDQPFGGANALNLCTGGVAASRLFQRDFVQGLVTRDAPLEIILAYELRNEYYYEGDQPPLSLTSGSVTTANGTTYDMSDATARQRMIDEGLVYFTNQVGAAIREVDPTALVTIGFFAPQGPNPYRIGDTRLVTVYPAIANSTVDFVDIHGYPSPGDLTIDQLMQNYGVVGFQQAKPVLMGEYGTFDFSYGLIGDAAAALKAWQIAGCAYHIRGWLLWSWDDYEQPPVVWNDQAGDGSIDMALAPAARPDPCAP